MGNGMNKIMPGLYLGNFRDAKDQKQLDENKITHIVAIHDQPKPILDNIQYKNIDAADSANEKLNIYFEDCAQFIHRARLEGGNVLVHCIAGISRSTTICCAYIMIISGVHWSDAILACRKARSQVNPNYGFQRQLQEFEAKITKVRQDLIQTVGPLNEEDKKFLTEQIASFDETQDLKSEIDKDNFLGTTSTFGSYERKRVDNNQLPDE
ncbi:dual specificity protein phosphatase 22-like [Clytia hemisphaerica]|uniref:Dual specificity protein phosphatase 15 n=1 Tax=Clytia hemisphaerica TaxID=252671 RepID=A0A7M5V094_9CNID|eukprot:TCONS_00066650-protein